MGRRDDLLVVCAGDLLAKCGMPAELDLLDRVITACGPSAFSRTMSTVDPENEQDRDHIRTHFLMRRLGLKDGPELAEAIEAAFEAYPSVGSPCYRPVVYYLLVKFFGRDAAL